MEHPIVVDGKEATDLLKAVIKEIERLRATNAKLLETLEPLTDYYILPHDAFMQKYSRPSTSGQKLDEWLRERANEARAAIEEARK